MKKLLLICLIFVLGNQFVNAQLVVGDIAFIGYNTDSGPGSNDNFTFICLTDIPGSEIIYFSEEGWDNATNDWAGTSEGHLTYTVPAAGLTCGSIVNINETSPNTFTITGGGTATHDSGSNWSLSGGDQILAYQSAVIEPGTPPTFIAGIHGDDGNGTPLAQDPVTKWSDSTPTPLGTARSELPVGLTNGDNCVALFPIIGTEVDNAKYTGTLTGTSTVIRAEINNYQNWSTDNGTAYDISPGTYTPSITCIPLSTDEFSLLNQLSKIFPNPNNGSFTLNYSGKEQLKELKVINMLGKRIQTISLKNFDNSQEINLTILAKGMYFITIQSDTATITKRMVIE